MSLVPADDHAVRLPRLHGAVVLRRGRLRHRAARLGGPAHRAGAAALRARRLVLPARGRGARAAWAGATRPGSGPGAWRARPARRRCATSSSPPPSWPCSATASTAACTGTPADLQRSTTEEQRAPDGAADLPGRLHRPDPQTPARFLGRQQLPAGVPRRPDPHGCRHPPTRWCRCRCRLTPAYNPYPAYGRATRAMGRPRVMLRRPVTASRRRGYRLALPGYGGAAYAAAAMARRSPGAMARSSSATAACPVMASRPVMARPARLCRPAPPASLDRRPPGYGRPAAGYGPPPGYGRAAWLPPDGPAHRPPARRDAAPEAPPLAPPRPVVIRARGALAVAEVKAPPAIRLTSRDRRSSRPP